MKELTFRRAEEKDCEKILYFIKELAAYEKMSELGDELQAFDEALDAADEKLVEAMDAQASGEGVDAHE